MNFETIEILNKSITYNDIMSQKVSSHTAFNIIMINSINK